ncbi:hypothetical protein [Polyangium aurulentum]|uniref:hypothetical protein n=1 Tax=Polyangium aurulentum TaxID=2567896 RepID=UPI0010ADF641|nr:hypothetical protein [Polyangium aurulentum]UQA56425.1 hypothetical protein E8A73_034690 [Polyangium aurulentum]
MRPAAARLTVAAMVVAGLALPAFGALTSCGSDAAGIEACRQIESARCEAMQACGLSADAAASCSSFYHDQCLHGVENPNADPSTAQIEACIAAVRAAADCARAGAANMAACPAAPLSPSADPGLAPCNVIGENAHLLSACAFVVKQSAPPASTSDAGTSDASASDAAMSDAGASDAEISDAPAD